MKKNLFMMALAAVTVLASCQKENGSDSDRVTDTKLKVRIANVGGQVRSVGTPATANQIALNDGIIFIMNAADEVTYREVINTASITSVSGQVLVQQVAKTDKVYIVGNLTTDLTTKLTTATDLTLAKINAELLSITSTVGQDYKKVTLANSNAQSVAITINETDNTAAVNVNIAPVYSRIELASVTGEIGTNQTLTSFDVTGVYVTDYYLQYTLGGLFGGTIYEQKQNLDFSLVDVTMKDENTWSSADVASKIVATAGTGNSWVYNVPADALPRLIVKLENVIGTKDSNSIENTNPYYLTLTGYSQSGAPIIKMERGKIYRVDNLKFNLDQMTTKPNDDKVTLTVQVTITDWVIEVVNGEL